MGSNEHQNRTEWLDETGGIPDLTGWLDDTLPMETVELPELGMQPVEGNCGQNRSAADWECQESAVGEDAFFGQERGGTGTADDETDAYSPAESVPTETDAEYDGADEYNPAERAPTETDASGELGEENDLPKMYGREYEPAEEICDARNDLNREYEDEEGDLCVAEPLDLASPDWIDESEDYPRLNPGEWDDSLDEEPEGWFSDDRIEKYYPEEEWALDRTSQEKLENLEEDEVLGNAGEELQSKEKTRPISTIGAAGVSEEIIEENVPDEKKGQDTQNTAALPVMHFEDEDYPPERRDAEEDDAEESQQEEQRTLGGLHDIWDRVNFVNLTAAALAIAIVIAMAVGVNTYSWNNKLQAQQTLLASVGDVLTEDQPLHTDKAQQLADIRIQKEEEQAAAEEAARQKAEEEAEQDAEEGSIAVEASLSTIQSDLKIKIRREKEQSLIGGVPFKVKVKDPKGKTTEQSDTDEDGIIYLTGLSSGTYEVTICQLIDLDSLKQQEDYRSNEDYINYSKYKISDKSQSIEVTDNITYEVVDVSDEVKSASEVNAAKEDTAKNDTPVESTIKDTVDWVESTKTEVDGGSGDSSYVEVQKSDVPDPYASASLTGTKWTASQFRMLAEVTSETSQESSSEGTSSSGESGTASSAETDASNAGSNESAAESSSGSSTGSSDAGTADSSASSETTSSSASDAASSAASGTTEQKDENAAGSSSASDTGSSGSTQKPELKVDPSEIHLTEGKTQSIKATISDGANTTVIYSSSDSSVATVSDGGTVQGVKAGSCTITVSLKDYTDVTQKVAVTVSEKTNDSTPLKDSSGNPLYVKDGDTYRAATAADYSKYDTFYRMTSAEKKYKYTGWQHINGLTYYYDKDGNYVTGSQIIQGVSYTFSDEGILDTGSTNAGIDVSMWNGKINWSEVAESGINFAIIRCGYRGSSTGTLVKDSSVGTNVTGAKNAGLKVGLYFFSQAINEAEAVEEASMAVQIAKSYGISMPIFLDVESSGGRGDAISTSQRTANIAAFCRTVQNAGYSAGVYANTNWFSEKINVGSLTSYHIWLAQYAASPTYSRSRYDIWQYSSTGRVNGISGDVDLDISYRSY